MGLVKRVILVAFIICALLVCAGTSAALAATVQSADVVASSSCDDPLNSTDSSNEGTSCNHLEEDCCLPGDGSAETASEDGASEVGEVALGEGETQNEEIDSKVADQISTTDAADAADSANESTQSGLSDPDLGTDEASEPVDNTAQNAPQVWTDKTDYYAGQTVSVSGQGFAGNEPVEVVINDDQQTEAFHDIPTSDSTGAFETAYTIPLEGRSLFYTVEATGLESGAYAATFFTDPPAPTAKGDQDFFGWKLDARTPSYPDWPGSWVKGDLGKNWREGDWVSYVLVLGDYGGDTLPPLNVVFDFYIDKNKDAIFVDLLRNFSYKIGDPYGGSGEPDDVTPANFEAWRDGSFTPEVINRPFPEGTADNQSTPPAFSYWQLTPNSNPDLAGTIPVGKSVVIYFEARLAPTFIWQPGNEYLLNQPPTDAWGGDRYGSPYSSDWNTLHSGAGFTSGSNPQFRLDGEGIGQKTIPIPIPLTPTGEIHGTKFYDLNNNGIIDAGEPGLPGWTVTLETTIDGIVFTHTSITDSNGDYVFTDLAPAEYIISELLQQQWTQTFPNCNQAYSVPINKPGAGPYGWCINLGENEISTGWDFGNFLPFLDIDIEKETNGEDADSAPGPEILEGQPVTWTYIVTNNSNVALTITVDDDDVVNPIGTITLAAGASQTLTRTGTAVSGQYENTATASATYLGQSVSDTDPSHYFGIALFVELYLVKTGPATATPGQTYTYESVYGNTGNTTAVATVITDTLRKKYVKEIVDADGGTVEETETDWIIRWPAEDIPANTEGLKKIVIVRLVDDMPVGITTIRNVAEIGFEVIGLGSETDDPSDNRSFVDTVVEVPETPPPPEEPVITPEEAPPAEEALPFTGLDWILLLILGSILMGSGMLLWLGARNSSA